MLGWGHKRSTAMFNKSNPPVATMGIDIGKNSFHVVGLDRRGAIVLRQKWSRGQIETRLANMPPCLIGMEACVGAHHVSRQLQSHGHDARLMPAKYVRAYSKGQKNDFRDAEAIAEAGRARRSRSRSRSRHRGRRDERDDRRLSAENRRGEHPPGRRARSRSSSDRTPTRARVPLPRPGGLGAASLVRFSQRSCGPR
jgi:transposase